MKRRVIKSIGASVLLALMVCLACMAGWAQSTAQINGSVRDASGAVLPGVEVTVTHTATGLMRTVVTDEAGSYTLASLPVGAYRLEAGLPGFRTFVQTGIVLQVSGNPVINAVLEVGQVTETVEVQADAALVETRNSGVGQVLDNQRVLELPLNGRQVTELILLSGVATTSENGTLNPGSRNYPTVIIQVAGGMMTGLTYNLDGGNHNDPYNNLNLPMPFPDALQEFKVETSGLAAQYGFHSSGAVNAVTKSGTNDLHGSVFEFLRNGSMNARNAFAVTNDGLKRNQFGGTIGGPVMKNKLFFFAGYQGTTERSRPSDNRAYIPTAAMMAGDFTAIASAACNSGRQVTLLAPFVDNRVNPSLFSKVALNLVRHKLFPTTSDPCGEVRFARRPKVDEKVTVARVDYQWNDKHSLYGRYLDARRDTPTDYDGVNILSLNTGDQFQRVYSFVLGDTYLIGGNTVSSFHGAVNRTNIPKANPEFFDLTELGARNIYESIPKMTLLSITNGFNIASSLVNPGHYNSTSFHLGEDLSIVKGVHQIALGGSLIHQIYNGDSGIARSPQPVFNGHFTNMGLADYLLGKPSSFSQGNAALSNTRQNSIGLYVHDTWKTTPRLTLNAGVRWEPNIAPYTIGRTKHFEKEWFDQGLKSKVYTKAPAGIMYAGDSLVPGVSMGYDHWLHFAPRAGLAWDLQGDGRTTVRAAYGLFYDLPPMFHWAGAGTGAPYSNQVNQNDPAGGLDDPWASYPGGNPFPTVLRPDVDFPTSVFYIDYDLDMKSAYVHQYNLSVQRQVATDWMVAANYIGNSTIHMQTAVEGNPALYVPGNCVAGQYGLTAAGPCSSTGNTNNRRILSVQNQAEGRYYANFTRVLDEGTSNYNGLLLSLQRRRSNGVTVQGNYTWAHCIGDFAVAAGGSTGQGYYPGRRWDTRTGCPGDTRHSLNMSTVYDTPQFANTALRLLASAWQISGIVRVQSGGYFTVVSGFDTALTAAIGSNRANQILGDPYAPNKSVNQWLNPAAFSRPAKGQWGNSAQAIQGPGAITINLGLTRTFRITERQSVQFRAEAFNAPNHLNPVLTTPILAINNANFGKIQMAKDPRIMQLALKYQF